MKAPEVAKLAERNFVTHVSWIASRMPCMRVSESLGVLAVDSGLPCDTFNFICRSHLRESDLSSRLPKILDFFAPQTPFSWWVGPADQPAGLGLALEKAGLQRSEAEVAMAGSLSSLQLSLPLPTGLEIRSVRNATELQDFAGIVAKNWHPPDPNVLAYYQAAESLLLEPGCPLRLFVGYMEGKPVATAELTLAGPTAGLYNIATLQEYRGRGIGSALTVAPLREALASGYQTAILQAAPDGLRIYERVGFAAFGEITEFKPATQR